MLLLLLFPPEACPSHPSSPTKFFFGGLPCILSVICLGPRSSTAMCLNICICIFLVIALPNMSDFFVRFLLVLVFWLWLIPSLPGCARQSLPFDWPHLMGLSGSGLATPSLRRAVQPVLSSSTTPSFAVAQPFVAPRLSKEGKRERDREGEGERGLGEREKKKKSHLCAPPPSHLHSFMDHDSHDKAIPIRHCQLRQPIHPAHTPICVGLRILQYRSDLL